MLKIDDLVVEYSDGNQVLNQLNIQVNDGETIGIIGANGAGKSTLLMTIVGILMPSVGKILIDEFELNKKNLIEIRRRVGVVFQNPDDQLFMSSVYDDLAFGPRNHGDSEEEVKERIDIIIKELGIEYLMNKNATKLSGGEKRIVGIATILVMDPSIILFDEPTSFLDPRTRRKLIKLLKGLQVTKLIATHDLDLALEICDRVILLKDGKIFAQGSAKEILTNQSVLEEAFLELPFCLQSRP